MSELIINTVLPVALKVIIAVCAGAITLKVIPYLKSKMTNAEITRLKGFIVSAVKVAERLDAEGKLNIPKKDYVEEYIVEKAAKLHIAITVEDLDMLRREAVADIKKYATPLIASTDATK